MGHLIDDFPLQTGRIFRVKMGRPWGVALHGSVCGAIGFLVAIPYLRHPQAWLYLGILWVFHILLDKGKLALASRSERGDLPLFLVDQVLHLGSFWLVAAALASTTPLWESAYLGKEVIRGVQVISAYLAATYGVLFLMSSFWKTLKLEPNPLSLKSKWLGFAERICIASFTAIGGLGYLGVLVSIVPRSLCLFKRPEKTKFLELMLSLVFGIVIGAALKPIFPRSQIWWR